MQRRDRLSNAYGMLFEEALKTASSGIVAAGAYWYAERPCEHFRVQMQPSGPIVLGQHSVQPNQLAEFIKHIRPVEYDSKGCVHMVYWGRDLMPWKAARQNLIAAWAVFLPTFCYSSAHGVMAAWMFSEIESYKYKNGL